MKKTDFCDFNQIFLNTYFCNKVLPNFWSGLSAQSHKQHGRHASSYTLAEQKVSKQQLIKFNYLGYIWCFTA